MTIESVLTIGQMVKKYGLSRTTLLYYDEIDLLKASQRSAANYRVYTKCDIERMERVMLLRSAGIPLLEIKRILDEQSTQISQCFEQRLQQINIEMQQLHQQQQVLASLLKDNSYSSQKEQMSKEKWTNMLRKAGLDDEGMHRWHQAYEKDSPEGHYTFLQSLNIEEEEIARIRNWSAT